MPFKPNELDPVNDLIMQALHFMRDLPPAGELEREQLRTRVYRHLSHAANEILNATFVRTMSEATGGGRGVVRQEPKKPKANQALLDAFQEELRKDLGV